MLCHLHAIGRTVFILPCRARYRIIFMLLLCNLNFRPLPLCACVRVCLYCTWNECLRFRMDGNWTRGRGWGWGTSFIGSLALVHSIKYSGICWVSCYFGHLISKPKNTHLLRTKEKGSSRFIRFDLYMRIYNTFAKPNGRINFRKRKIKGKSIKRRKLLLIKFREHRIHRRGV